MRKFRFIEVLHDSLQSALGAGVIQDWSVDGPNVLMRRGGAHLVVPIMEAPQYLKVLMQEGEVTANSPET